MNPNRSPLHAPRTPPMGAMSGSGVPLGPDGEPLETGNNGNGSSVPQLSLRETAIDATSRKEHAVNRGYYRDPFLQCFTGDNTFVNSPLMNRGYWLRVRAVESAVNRFLEMYPEDAVQIVSLGAGYDTLYFRWAAAACSKHGNEAGTAAGADLQLPTSPNLGDFARLHRYVEIDHEDVVGGKREIIVEQAGMNDLAHLKSDQSQPKDDKEAHEHSNCMYRLIAADLRKPEDLVSALMDPKRAQASCVIPSEHDSGFSCIDPTMPTLILAECVLVYMTAEESTACLNSLVNGVFGSGGKGKDTPVMLLSYDAVGPDDRFGKVMVEALRSRGIPLLGIEQLKTPVDHEKRATAVGFNAVRSQTMKQLYDTVPLDERRKLDNIERIDDWDEWNLLHDHYALTFAGRLSAADSEKRGGHMPNLFLGTTVASDSYAGGVVSGYSPGGSPQMASTGKTFAGAADGAEAAKK